MSLISDNHILHMAQHFYIEGRKNDILTFGRKLMADAVHDVHQWQPIETAPKDNKRQLYLAEISSTGEILDMDFGGFWGRDNYAEPGEPEFTWFGSQGISNPTHWCFMGDALPPPYHTAGITAESSRGDVWHAVAAVLGAAIGAIVFGLWISLT
jgi:hypothetical protein